MKAGVMWWAGEEAARRFDVTEQDLLLAGVESKDIMVAQKNGRQVSDSLFNLEKMPHASGTSVDVGLLKAGSNERVIFFDLEKDGMDSSFLGFYEQFEDDISREFVRLQKLLGQVFLANVFEYGSKREVWHFDFVGNLN